MFAVIMGCIFLPQQPEAFYPLREVLDVPNRFFCNKRYIRKKMTGPGRVWSAYGEPGCCLSFPPWTLKVVQHQRLK